MGSLKLAVSGKNSSDVKKLKSRIRQAGHKVVIQEPDIVISFGGDGSFLHSERLYPSVPKVALRDKSLCLRCNENKLEDVLRRLESGRYRLKTYHKIEAEVKRKGKKAARMTAANDIVIRNVLAYHGLRFEIYVDGKKLPGTRYGSFIADGIIVATPFGSTGYFESASRKSFRRGIGLAFNNPTLPQKPIIGPEHVFRLKVTRNCAHVCADNDFNCIRICEGDSVRISKKNEVVKRIELV